MRVRSIGSPNKPSTSVAWMKSIGAEARLILIGETIAEIAAEIAPGFAGDIGHKRDQACRRAFEIDSAIAGRGESGVGIQHLKLARPKLFLDHHGE